LINFYQFNHEPSLYLRYIILINARIDQLQPPRQIPNLNINELHQKIHGIESRNGSHRVMVVTLAGINPIRVVAANRVEIA